MTCAHILYRLVNDYPGKAAQLHKDMGLRSSPKIFNSKLNVNCDTNDIGVKGELEMLLDFTQGNKEVAEYFAEKANCVVVQLPDIPDMSDMALLDCYMDIMRELGQLATEFQTSYADGVINDKEFKKISVDIDAVQARLLAFKAAVKRVKR